MTTLAKVNSSKLSQEATTTMAVQLPPGFNDAPSRPLVYVGGEIANGPAFYVWNHDESKRDYVPIQKFAAQLTDVKLVTKNAGDPIKEAVKLVLEFSTSQTGERVGLSMGVNTWAAMGTLAGLSALTREQLADEIGLYGKVGKSGKTTFISVYAGGNLQRNEANEALLKEGRGDDAYIPTVEGIISQIKENLG